ncbi:PREDICTED: F-box/WD repeat-containing protein 12 isoform X2 [Rhinopithecus bieti]|uniref:F-box/WD repeat-containing protein 12 isoform X2 n=1 Tax=Rhinopithecus bieti TaxID=61621 RepID=UPI00083BC9F9|nr:PREDICTED: F-box/WD repeat-containing protein 12 isoform X2 [Rhinopithecus bieti]
MAEWLRSARESTRRRAKLSQSTGACHRVGSEASASAYCLPARIGWEPGRTSSRKKHWNRIAESDFLWRSLSLERWDCSNFTDQHLGTHTWKQFFLHQRRKELQLALAQPHNFIYKVTKNIAYEMELAYLSGNSLTMKEQEKSIICSVSPKQELCAWDVQEVGDVAGDIYTFTLPGLRDVSKVTAFQYGIALLHCSPDKKWVFACGTYSRTLPQVFLTESLVRPSEGSAPLSTSLPHKLCVSACWTPEVKNRITLMSQSNTGKKTEFITFDLTTKRTGGQTVIQAHEIASFQLAAHLESPIWMGANDGYTIVFTNGPYLLLFSITGFLLQRFEDHQAAINNFWVDPRYVLTTSKNSVHVYMWEEGGRHPYLRSCCHLENIWHDPTTHGCISSVMCDNASIVLKVTVSESSTLVMYSLNM